MQIKLLSSMILLCLSTIGYTDDPTTQKPIPASTQSIAQENPPTTPISSKEPATSSIINCEYKIPATQEIQNDIVITWSEKAAIQSFTYNSENIDEKLLNLKNCFTDQGYTSYTDALSKSGNVEAIKSQQLSVSSIVDGKTKINKLEDHKWQIKVPLQVVYQNNKEKLTQLLFIDMLVARKVSGDLGISQIIAAPRDKIIEKKSEKA